jgi:hypothetical protein
MIWLQSVQWRGSMTPRQFREEVFRRAGPDLSQSSLTAAVEHYIEDRLLETMMDYDEAHDTFTICMVWPKCERALARVR